MKILKSALDSSVNFVFDTGVECRFVQRSTEYFIIYVSSHNGCNKACRFCHLTQTGQTDYKTTFYNQYLDQVKVVVDYWEKEVKPNMPSPQKVHVNFMARGEPLDNPVLVRLWGQLSKDMDGMIKKATNVGQVKFKISTIMPKSEFLYQDLVKNLKKGVPAEIYYSMYSVSEEFRKRWIPKAIHINDSLPIVKSLIDEGLDVTFHHALIKGHNATIKDAKAFVATLRLFGISGVDFNLVRYNPFSSDQGVEANDRQIMNYLSVLKDCGLFKEVKMIPRVGFDVSASCGLFTKVS